MALNTAQKRVIEEYVHQHVTDIEKNLESTPSQLRAALEMAISSSLTQSDMWQLAEWNVLDEVSNIQIQLILPYDVLKSPTDENTAYNALNMFMPAKGNVLLSDLIDETTHIDVSQDQETAQDVASLTKELITKRIQALHVEPAHIEQHLEINAAFPDGFLLLLRYFHHTNALLRNPQITFTALAEIANAHMQFFIKNYGRNKPILLSKAENHESGFIAIVRNSKGVSSLIEKGIAFKDIAQFACSLVPHCNTTREQGQFVDSKTHTHALNLLLNYTDATALFLQVGTFEQIEEFPSSIRKKLLTGITRLLEKGVSPKMIKEVVRTEIESLSKQKGLLSLVILNNLQALETLTGTSNALFLTVIYYGIAYPDVFTFLFDPRKKEVLDSLLTRHNIPLQHLMQTGKHSISALEEIFKMHDILQDLEKPELVKTAQSDKALTEQLEKLTQRFKHKLSPEAVRASSLNDRAPTQEEQDAHATEIPEAHTFRSKLQLLQVQNDKTCEAFFSPPNQAVSNILNNYVSSFPRTGMMRNAITLMSTHELAPSSSIYYSPSQNPLPKSDRLFSREKTTFYEGALLTFLTMGKLYSEKDPLNADYMNNEELKHLKLQIDRIEDCPTMDTFKALKLTIKKSMYQFRDKHEIAINIRETLSELFQSLPS